MTISASHHTQAGLLTWEENTTFYYSEATWLSQGWTLNKQEHDATLVAMWQTTVSVAIMCFQEDNFWLQEKETHLQ